MADSALEEPIYRPPKARPLAIVALPKSCSLDIIGANYTMGLIKCQVIVDDYYRELIPAQDQPPILITNY